MTDYIPREIHAAIARALKAVPVVVITGMRQTGKTTFLRNDSLFRDFTYVTLDDFGVLESARTHPEGLVGSGGRLCIDEVQKVPELLTTVKLVVDRNRRPGMFVLSGSANFALLKGMSESLAGRAVYLPLHPFSRRESGRAREAKPFLPGLLTGRPKIESLHGERVGASEVLRGGMPAVSGLSADAASVWFRGFEQTYVERDIRDIARIDDLLGFRSVVRLGVLRTGQILNVSQLARDARLSTITTNRYLHLAETSFLFRRLPPFLRNRSSRLVKSHKLYVTDSGIASHLAGVESIDSADEEPLRGALFETYALQNISAILDTYLPDARISFWHVQGRYEVDFVVEYKRKCVALEVKAAERWSSADVASLKAFIAATPSCIAAILLYNGTSAVRLGEKLWAMPMGMVLG